MAVLRWWAGKVGKQNIVARPNDHYGIPNRRFVTNDSKAKIVDIRDLAKIPDAWTASSICPAAIRGTDRLAFSGSGWSNIETADP